MHSANDWGLYAQVFIKTVNVEIHVVVLQGSTIIFPHSQFMELSLPFPSLMLKLSIIKLKPSIAKLRHAKGQRDRFKRAALFLVQAMPVVKYASSYLLLQAFRDVVADEGVLPEPTKNLLFSTFDPIYDFHCAFLSELEQRMAL